MNLFKKLFVLLLLGMISLGSAVLGNHDTEAPYWPKESWRTSTPEAVGMDSERIYAMLKSIKEVEHAAAIPGHKHSTRFEKDLPVFVCRKPKMSLQKVWEMFEDFH